MTEALRDHVEMGLVGKRHLRSAEAAKGARRDGVRINGVRIREHMRNTVRSVARGNPLSQSPRVLSWRRRRR